METWEIKEPPHRRGRSKTPSFSSSLLDAVLRSIDDDSLNHQTQPPSQCRRDWSAESPVNNRPVGRNCIPATDYRHRSCPRRGAFATESRSPSSSSSSATAATSTVGFSSSSDAESVRANRISRSGSPAMENGSKKSKLSYIRGGLRGLRRGRATTSAAATAVTPPASPGARLARFLNSLLAAARSSKKTKSKIPATGGAAKLTATGGSGGGGELTRCSSASLSRRSCMRKGAHRQRRAGAEETRRSVRFYPLSVIVDEESGPCGHRRLRDKTVVEAAAVRPVATRVEELLMATSEEEEEEEDQAGMSEASSDLFELENLTPVMETEGGRSSSGGGYRDELPLYETTDCNVNYANGRDLNIWKNNFSSARLIRS